MKHLNLVFDDKEHAEIKAKKDASGLSWEKFILKMVKEGVDENE